MLVTNPYTYMPDPARGRPLFNASIYVGEPDLDPETHPIPLNYILEDGSAVPAPNPVDTGAGGVIVYNGKPVQIDCGGGNYSLRVRDSRGGQVYYVPNYAASGGNPSNTFTKLSIASSMGLVYVEDWYAGVVVPDDAMTDKLAYFHNGQFYSVGTDTGFTSNDFDDDLSNGRFVSAKLTTEIQQLRAAKDVKGWGLISSETLDQTDIVQTCYEEGCKFPAGTYLLKYRGNFHTYFNTACFLKSGIPLLMDEGCIFKIASPTYSAWGCYNQDDIYTEGGFFEGAGARFQQVLTATHNAGSEFSIATTEGLEVGMGVSIVDDTGALYARLIHALTPTLVTVDTPVAAVCSSGVGELRATNTYFIAPYYCDDVQMYDHNGENYDILYAPVGSKNVLTDDLICGDTVNGLGSCGYYGLLVETSIHGKFLTKKVSRGVRFSGETTSVESIVSDAEGITYDNLPLSTESMTAFTLGSLTGNGGNTLTDIDNVTTLNIGQLIGYNIQGPEAVDTVNIRGCRDYNINSINIKNTSGGQGGLLTIQSSKNGTIKTVKGSNTGGILVLKNPDYLFEPDGLTVDEVNITSPSGTKTTEYLVRCKGSNCHFKRVTGNAFSIAAVQNSDADSALYADSGKWNTYNEYASNQTGNQNYSVKTQSAKATIRYTGSAWVVNNAFESAGINDENLTWSVDGSGGRLLIDITHLQKSSAPIVLAHATESTAGTNLDVKAIAGSAVQIVVGFYSGGGTRVTAESDLMNFNIFVM